MSNKRIGLDKLLVFQKYLQKQKLDYTKNDSLFEG